jgi:DNA-binding PucR family transcriptional regulator
LAGTALQGGRERDAHDDVLQALATSLLARCPELAAGMARHLHEIIPEFGGVEDSELLEETRASCEGNIAQVLRLIKRGAPASSLVIPPEAAEYASGLVRRNVPLPVLLRAYRLGHAWLWERWTAAVHEQVSDPDVLMAVLDQSTAFLFEYVDTIADPLVEAYGAERERLHRSVTAVRAETVKQLLAGEAIDDEAAARRLGYELRRWHVALKATGGDGAARELAGLERAVAEAAARLGCAQPLVIPSGAAALCVWCGMHARPADDALKQLEGYQPPDGVRIAVGAPAVGVDGFRRTHEEATQAARVGSLAGGACAPVVSYRNLELASLLTSDFERARRFVSDQLGPLAHADDSAARLRETARAFLDANGSNVRVARALHVHQNTVIYRINRVEELLGRPVTEHQTELACALHLAATLGEAVLDDE